MGNLVQGGVSGSGEVELSGRVGKGHQRELSILNRRVTERESSGEY